MVELHPKPPAGDLWKNSSATLLQMPKTLIRYLYDNHSCVLTASAALRAHPMSISQNETEAPRAPPANNYELAFEHIRGALQGLQFGAITIVVQHGRVVQIERHEKIRLFQTE
jgi:hypothetical protein